MSGVAASHRPRACRILAQLQGDPLRATYETFIRARYAEAHGARLVQFMPNLIGCLGADEQPLAVLGYRSAADDRLFLEQYVDGPIEQVIESSLECIPTDEPVARIGRRRIVEVGNFASRDRQATLELMQRLPGYLAGEGFEWLVFTGTPRVCALVAGFGAPLLDLGSADSTRVNGGTEQWGRYYDGTPRVMAGWLGHCVRVAA